MMNADEHPALRTECANLYSLTLVLPEHLEQDQLLQGLVMAIVQIRTGLAWHSQFFEALQNNCAIRRDQVRQALCRGQALAYEQAATIIDEAIVEVFDLWGQYDAQPPHPARNADRPDEEPGPSADEGEAAPGRRGPEMSG
jgi:hypothetical protein